jgi:hypothetical protein
MIPIPSALMIKIGLALAACAIFYFMGYSHEHKKFVAFQAEIAAIGKAQETINAAKVKEHENLSESIKSEYDARLSAIHNYYANGVRPDTGRGNLPAVSKPAECPNVATADAGLARRCAQTTLQLTELQKWVQSVTK